MHQLLATTKKQDRRRIRNLTKELGIGCIAEINGETVFFQERLELSAAALPQRLGTSQSSDLAWLDSRDLQYFRPAGSKYPPRAAEILDKTPETG
ncbi:MAG TPA: hypothetical protein VLR45_02320 [Desulfoprunum sp.]|nr:hypothetical protein [Desulfoprunum sp.]